MILRETEEQLNRRRQIMLDELEHIRKQLELEESYYQDALKTSSTKK